MVIQIADQNVRCFGIKSPDFNIFFVILKGVRKRDFFVLGQVST